MQWERILFLTLFNSYVSEVEIETCPKMQEPKLYFKAKQPIN